MISRPYAAAKRTLSIAEKLMEVNWGLVLLITIIATGGIAMLYSVAGGHFHPWALSQLSKFIVGLFILAIAATIDVRVWMSLAYPAYAVASGASVFVRGVCTGTADSNCSAIVYGLG